MEPPAAAGPVGPRRSTAGLPVKGAALRSASLRDSPAGLPSVTASLAGRAPTPYGGGVKRPAARAGRPDRPTSVASRGGAR
jgi:hypothetical protein